MQRLVLLVSLLILAAFSHAQNPFPNGYLRIGSIQVEGNKKTKDKIILRELMFQENEVYALQNFQELRKKSEQNLMNTALFLKAEVSLIEGDSGSSNILVKVIERWYLWPIPQVDIDERNFNVWWEHKRLDRLSAGVF